MRVTYLRLDLITKGFEIGKYCIQKIIGCIIIYICSVSAYRLWGRSSGCGVQRVAVII